MLIAGTTIRLPIGYFSLSPQFCKGTPFEPYAAVYNNCWSSIRDLIHSARQNGIGILIDLHAVPGGANREEHSGTNMRRAELWDKSSHRDRATECLTFMASEVHSGGLEGVIGIQVCNEAIWDAPGMFKFYDKVSNAITHVDPTIPIYISDAWNLEKGLDYALSKNSKTTFGNPIVVDTHIYFCFDQKDKSRSPQDIIANMPSKLDPLDRKAGSVADRGAVEAIVGEYSCVLDGQTWDKSGGADREMLVRQFGNVQSQRYQQRTGGSFFWTYKMDWMPGGEWGFVAQTQNGAITPPQYLTHSPEQVQQGVHGARDQREHLKGESYGAHCHYWDTNYPGRYDHPKYEQGWEIGFDDATRFYEGVDGIRGRIGMAELWILKRAREGGLGREEFMWEWEQGFRKGVEDFERCVGMR
jgi:aryl-phospho-beta-D-glucosidase BglC (GH1 family)